MNSPRDSVNISLFWGKHRECRRNFCFTGVLGTRAFALEIVKIIHHSSLLSYFLYKKLLVGALVCYEWINGWVSRVSQWEMYVCHTNQPRSQGVFPAREKALGTRLHTNQIGSTINSQSNFLFLLQVNVTRHFYLLVSNGNWHLFFTHSGCI